MEKFEFTNLSKILAIYAQDINALIRNISHTMQKLLPEVLVSDEENQEWAADIFSHVKDEGYMCAGDAWWKYCIPFSGNEHLLGTTNEPK